MVSFRFERQHHTIHNVLLLRRRRRRRGHVDKQFLCTSITRGMVVHVDLLVLLLFHVSLTHMHAHTFVLQSCLYSSTKTVYYPYTYLHKDSYVLWTSNLPASTHYGAGELHGTRKVD